jgi:carbonic anhydrase
MCSGQHPFATGVSCSNSRVPPEIVFDVVPGDLFGVQEARHLADAVTLGSIEYAVERLHAHLAAVSGRINGGAVAAAADVITKNAAPEGHIGNLVDDIRTAIERSRSGLGKCVARAIRAIVGLVAENIRRSHPILFDHLADGDVKVVGAVYDLETGAIEWRWVRLRLDAQRQHLAWLALGKHLQRPAAHFAVSDESLVRHAGVHQQFHRLAAVGALDLFSFLHVGRLARNGGPAIRKTAEFAARRAHSVP